MTSNLPMKSGYVISAHSDISSLDEWRTQAYGMPNYSKKRLKDGMTKESKSGSLKLENMFFCTTLILDFLQEISSRNGRPLCHRGGLPVWSHQDK